MSEPMQSMGADEHAALVADLEDLLERARKGLIVGLAIAALTFDPDETFETEDPEVLEVDAIMPEFILYAESEEYEAPLLDSVRGLAHFIEHGPPEGAEEGIYE